MRPLLIFGCAVTVFLVFHSSTARAQEVPIVQQWEGLYRLTNLNNFPESQRDHHAAVITDGEDWATFWGDLQIEDKSAEPPVVDFQMNLVILVCSISSDDYLSIGRTMLNQGSLEVVMEVAPRRYTPTEIVRCTIVVVPRAGVQRVGSIELE